MANPTTAKHSRWWTHLAGFGVWLVMQLICMTIRIRSEREVSEDEYDQTILACIWHNRNFICPYTWNTAQMKHPMGAFTSASKDGALLESVVSYFGIKSYRGSSHRRGATAFLEALESVAQGACLAITPDGPRGPVYKIQPGIVKLASLAGVPIVAFCIDYENCWRIGKAWDKYCIPKPFSTVRVLWRKPYYVPAGLSDEELYRHIAVLEGMMALGQPDFEPLQHTDLCK